LPSRRLDAAAAAATQRRAPVVERKSKAAPAQAAQAAQGGARRRCHRKQCWTDNFSREFTRQFAENFSVKSLCASGNFRFRRKRDNNCDEKFVKRDFEIESVVDLGDAADALLLEMHKLHRDFRRRENICMESRTAPSWNEVSSNCTSC